MGYKNGKNNKHDYKRRGRTEGDRYRDSDSKGKTGNHLEWYVTDGGRLANVANIPWGYRTGDPIPVSDSTLVIPGIVGVQYIPCYGEMTSPSSPFNTAATAVYSYVRHANSGSKNYDAPDLMLYLMAMDSIYSGINYVQRALALLLTYNNANKYYPHALYHGMGVKWDADLIGNSLSYVNRLNNIIQKTDTLAVPNVFSVYRRHAYMNSHVYMDENNPHAQAYVFMPKYLYKFELDDNFKGMLSLVEWADPTVDRPISEYLDLLDGMIDAIYGDEDAGLMSGDITRAYGSGNLFQIKTITSDVSLTPIYDSDMLQQIHNATIGPYDVTAITQVLSESDEGLTGFLRQNITVPVSGHDAMNYYAGNQILDIHGEPSPEMVMRTTRLKAAAEPVSVVTPGTKLNIKYPPSELVTKVVILNLTSDGAIFGSQIVGPMSTNGDNQYTLISRFSQVSYAPIIAMYDPDEEDERFIWKYIANTDRVTSLSPANIDAINREALLGLFNIPSLSMAKS